VVRLFPAKLHEPDAAFGADRPLEQTLVVHLNVLLRGY
jgi:hypothetical protein